MSFATVNFYSRCLNRTVTCNVIMPTDRYGFDRHSTKPKENSPKKTLYLLHGVMGSYIDWMANTRLLQLASAKNIAIVMPSGDNKFYCDSEISGDMYGQFISEELVRFTRDTFNLSRKREDTFIGGLSMGGFGAIVNALRSTEQFSHVVALSSALIKCNILNAVDGETSDFFTATQYCTMFDIPTIADFEGCDCDYDALAKRAASSGKPLPKFYMACGQQDFLFPMNTAYRDLLRSLNYDVTWVEKPGIHNWAFWDDQIEAALEWLPLEEANEGISSGNVGK